MIDMETLRRLVAADMRNLDDLARAPCVTEDALCRVVADCAERYVDANGRSGRAATNLWAAVRLLRERTGR